MGRDGGVRNDARIDSYGRDADMVRAASMYYLQDLTMETIARHLGTSRSTVSRLVKRARETGIVEITLRSPEHRVPGLAHQVGDPYGIEVHVVPVPDLTTEDERLAQVARTAARLVGSWFDSGMVLGVAWGTTLAAIAAELPTKPTRGSAVVQLNGAGNRRSSGIEYAGALVEAFGAAFDAELYYFPVPAFFDYAETRDAMWRERSVRGVLEMQARCDIALFSVGALAGGLPSHVYSAGYLEPEDVQTLDAEGVVGDVCTVFLRADGTYSDIPLNERATGPNPAQLRRIARRVCVVAGDNKVEPLRGALEAGVVTHLVVDELTAHAYVDRYPG
ncbi:sugar-binding transcriptional regulator [Luteimicrobium subarcticum]|uniref:Transcriptional regulator n=1 Tax=Luteimicrobium subarcticum TaxID=620910 RepID=A0A2M8WVW4_9MICO|nr:sugar-binding transcriptional regulator [Luteimicrobium subarcticum]PJI95053.1 transcriptional regulator [Luteimicrobium subarcticum]